VALTEGLALLRAVPGIDESARRFLLDRTADRHFHFAHLSPHNIMKVKN
jgi:hypothetical protein